jgi:Nif-specific regulatory protein
MATRKKPSGIFSRTAISAKCPNRKQSPNASIIPGDKTVSGAAKQSVDCRRTPMAFSKTTERKAGVAVTSHGVEKTECYSSRQLDALSHISEILATQTHYDKMFHGILAVLERQLNYLRGTILLLSPDSKELIIEEAQGDVAKIDRDIRYHWGEGIVGQVVESGKPAIVPKISEEPLFRDRIYRRKEFSNNECSFICVPIKNKNEVEGTLSADIEYDADRLLDADLRLWTIIASMIAREVNSVRRARQERESLEAENLRLLDALGRSFRPDAIIGTSSAMNEVYLRIHRVEKSDTTVLIRGESGTGKEIVATAIHYSSPRSGKKSVKVNCSALNENLLESELFGHEKGSFTGAFKTRIGRIEEAEGGTLFLDEIGDLSPVVQVKLLRFLQEREFERIGSNETKKSDVRVICATNRNLEQAVESGAFRSDLYYRINVFPIYLPPLRQRKEDIPALVNHFMEKFSSKIGKQMRRISTSAISMLMAYHWPGNIRELENCIEHAVLVSSDGVIHGADLPPSLQMPSSREVRLNGKLKERVEAMERDLIADALKHLDGSITLASRDLGITSRMLRYKMDNLGIDHSFFTKKPA